MVTEAMRGLIERYRNYVVGRVRATKPATGIVEVQGLFLPWMLPVAAAGAICYFLDLSYPQNLYVIVPCLVIGLAGGIYMGCIYLGESYRIDRQNQEE